MYIYNVTVNIDESVQRQWLDYMLNSHIPAMLATGKFMKALITRVMVEEEMGGVTYSVQYTTDSKETLDKYHAEDADLLYEKGRMFQGKYVAFSSELQVIGEAHNEEFEKDN